MTNEELILEKLERLEAQIQPLVKNSQKLEELKNDLIPIGNHATALLIEQLTEVEAGFQLEDFLRLVKEAMRNTQNFIFALKQMANIIEFIKDLEPLLKSAVPQFINMLDEMERKGVLRMFKSTLDLRKKVAAAYTAEDIELMGDTLITYMGLFKSLSDPKAIKALEQLSRVPSKIDLENVKRVGLLSMLGAGFNPEINQGLGIMMELAKAMGRIAPAETQA